MSRPLGSLSVNPASGYYSAGSDPVTNFAIPQGLSSARHQDGYEQQTFLGASIRSFNINAGFGDSTSTLNVELVNDEFNKSDGTNTGVLTGDDIYHSGNGDGFIPPPVGSPVFFKFGKKKASVQDTYAGLYDQIYKTNNASNPEAKLHFCFGGILQSYVENRGQGGDPLYSVQVVDPRELLSNVVLILNQYAGSTYNTDNLFNIYGFLEFNQTKAEEDRLRNGIGSSSVLQRYDRSDGSHYFSGVDMYYSSFSVLEKSLNSGLHLPGIDSISSTWPTIMPITGTGFSRRGPQGMPYYRIRQALGSLTWTYGKLPQNYLDAGFSGRIKFRGLNYLVDLGGLPQNVPGLYYMDFDQINLLDFCLEVCSITNHELFVSLLPIINHPVCERFRQYNQTAPNSDLIAGIIRIDAIDKSYQPQYGAIKSYLDTLDRIGIPIENRDVGFEVSNVTTDKFVVGAQETEMYFFSSNHDRGMIEARANTNPDPNIAQQWKLETMLKQQILPYYGMIGEAVTIPKGFGPYQQILLDSSSLYAVGVGNYYVATEMELRSASISYEKWADFLLMYNDIYMEALDPNDKDALGGIALDNKPKPPEMDGFTVDTGGNYGVTVPRSVWPGFKNEFEDSVKGKVSTPKESCHPPYGYPLYFKRAEKIGVNGIGLTSIQGKLSQIITDLATVYAQPNNPDYVAYVDSSIKNIQNTIKENCAGKSETDAYKLALFKAIQDGASLGIVEASLKGAKNMQKVVSQMQKRTKENSLRVYNWLKKIADECLGKKFLVKIPREPNLSYQINITTGAPGTYNAGPFGFEPRLTNKAPDYLYSSSFKDKVSQAKGNSPVPMMHKFLSADDGRPRTISGGLEVNWNPIADKFETNYVVDTNGGYIDFDLMNNMTGNKPFAVKQGLMPIDMKPIMNGNRMSAYARFDNSQNLAFNNVNSDDFTQQTKLNNYMIPDICYNLDNIGTGTFSFPVNIANQGAAAANAPVKDPSVAFVKCDIDSKFYYAPKTVMFSAPVYGSDAKDIGEFPSEPKRRLNENTCECQDLIAIYKRHYVPEPTTTGNVDVLDFIRRTPRDENGNEFVPSKPQVEYETKLKNLDPLNVYALITLPCQIVPKQDSRFNDGPMTEINADKIKHLLTMDVVKLPEFAKPAYMNKPSVRWDSYRSTLSPSTIISALNARKAAFDSLQFGFPQRLQATAPSPVYPDLVAIPLMSMERCYGPWSSNYLTTSRYTGIGGRVDFIKDENLAPWNFNGYDLMNAAGKLQAYYANSLLVQSERGGAVIPAAPSGVYLGRYLNNVGPLLTNLSVDVSEGGIKTTFKFDLYTVSFGKLAKQKQEQISSMSRERQKLRDEKNALIRKGLGKEQSSISFTKIYNTLNQAMDSATKSFGTLVLSTQPEKQKYQGQPEDNILLNNGSITNNDEISAMMGYLEPDTLAQKYSRSASADISTIFFPVDTSHAANPFLHAQAFGISQDQYNEQYKT